MKGFLKGIKGWLIGGIFFAVGLLSLFLVTKFMVMPWESSELPELENPRLVVKKKERLLEVFDGQRLVKTYNVVLGFTPTGDKELEGDGKTPEGEFYVFTKNPESRFHLSLGISYPGPNDARKGLSQGLISQEEHDQIVEAFENKKMPPQKTKLGGEIYIHGGGTVADWTDGCVALRNEEMEQLFRSIPVGTPVLIGP
ncbi:MAG: L,D-transpeptidase [Pyrinomonadaceae bacterium]